MSTETDETDELPTEPPPMVVTGSTTPVHLDLGDTISGSTEDTDEPWSVAVTADSLSVARGDGAWIEVGLPQQWTGDATIARVVTYEDDTEHLALDIARAGVLLHAELSQIEAGVTEWREVWI